MKLDYVTFNKYSDYSLGYYIEKMNRYFEGDNIPIENIISIIERKDEFVVFFKN
jgi:hypothetical protein